MLYTVKKGDTLERISRKYGVSMDAILKANVICNPNYIFEGEPLILPNPEIPLPKAGGSPYYVIYYGDSLWCLSQQFSKSVEALMQANELRDPNWLVPGMELLVVAEKPDPEQLYREWNILQSNCEFINSLWHYAVFYLGSFQWEALGERAVPYLLHLLEHPCYIVRSAAVISLGRIGKGNSVRLTLERALSDSDENIVHMAQLALKRVEYVSKWSKRVHVTTYHQRLYNTLLYSTTSVEIPEGTPIIVLRWNIPDPEGSASPPGALDVFDLIQVLETGQKGYLRRVSYGSIWLI